MPKGTAVRVYTSNGLASAVPDVVTPNQNFNSARSQLQSAGFTDIGQSCVVAAVTDPPSSLDKVVTQDPGAGAVVNRGTKVTLAVKKLNCGGPKN